MTRFCTTHIKERTNEELLFKARTGLNIIVLKEVNRRAAEGLLPEQAATYYNSLWEEKKNNG